jgi:hypothetical protein
MLIQDKKKIKSLDAAPATELTKKAQKITEMEALTTHISSPLNWTAARRWM